MIEETTLVLLSNLPAIRRKLSVKLRKYQLILKYFTPAGTPEKKGVWSIHNTCR